MGTSFYSHIAADNYRLCKSLLLNAPDDDTYDLIRIPKYAFIFDVWVNITTAFSHADAVCSVGWSGNGETAQTAGFIPNDVFQPTVTGLKRATHASLVAWAGKYFSSANGAVTCTVAKGSSTTVGVFTVFVAYTIIH